MIGAGICAGVSGLCWYGSSKATARAQLVKDSKKASLSDVKADLANAPKTYALVSGTTACKDPVISTINGVPCVHFKASRTYGNYFTTHESDSSPLELEDAGMKARIIPTHSGLPTEKLPESFKHFVLKFFGYAVKEEVLRVNRDIFVLGSWEGKGQVICKGTNGTSEQPCIIQLGTWEDYVREEEKAAFGLKVCSGVFGIGAVVLPFAKQD